MKVAKAFVKDLSAIIELLQENDLPVRDVPEHISNFLIVKEQDQLCGCVAIEIYRKVGLLRSLAVSKACQGRGYGLLLTEALFSYAKKKKIEQLYLLTTTAAGYFKKFGFQTIDRSEAHQDIQNTTEFKDLCPCSAILMIKEL